MPSESTKLLSVPDHLVVTAASLQAGIDFIESRLQTAMSIGGCHVHMGTYNAVLKLGEGLYLEVIAIDPDAPPINRARWFGLDRLSAVSEPQLATWVARTNNIEAAIAATGEWTGPVEPMSRGALEWKITIPPDGKMPFAGVAPAIIQWAATSHPTEKMPTSEVSLVELQMVHPEASELNRRLAEIGFEHSQLIPPAISGKSPRLAATFRTLAGEVRLG